MAEISGHVHQACRHHRLDRDACGGVLLEDGVEDRVRDTVADLVRVTFSDRLGREQT